MLVPLAWWSTCTTVIWREASSATLSSTALSPSWSWRRATMLRREPPPLLQAPPHPSPLTPRCCPCRFFIYLFMVSGTVLLMFCVHYVYSTFVRVSHSTHTGLASHPHTHKHTHSLTPSHPHRVTAARGGREPSRLWRLALRRRTTLTTSGCLKARSPAHPVSPARGSCDCHVMLVCVCREESASVTSEPQDWKEMMTPHILFRLYMCLCKYHCFKKWQTVLIF